MRSDVLDHLVYATPHLEETVLEFGRRTGVRPAEGGRHKGMGTRNHLVGLGGQRYLEIIGPDPEQGVAPQWFGLAELTEPRLVAWCVRPADLDATIAAARAQGYDPGPAREMSRRTPDGDVLQWRLTAHLGDPVVPFLISWGATKHPGERGLPEVALESFTAGHPEPDAVRGQLDALGVELDVVREDEPVLTARLGGVVLS
ncbi:VOC family protein [Nonomuraea sp. B19D2]|uniref:VOC family protein n=1 Tax=Nonomuraea sp. B19D2 TaxID=3159561 RepID=UPI0032DB8B32